MVAYHGVKLLINSSTLVENVFILQGKKTLKERFHNELFCFEGNMFCWNWPEIYPLRFTHSLPLLLLLILSRPRIPSRDCIWRYNFLKDKWTRREERKKNQVDQVDEGYSRTKNFTAPSPRITLDELEGPSTETTKQTSGWSAWKENAKWSYLL